MITKKSFYNKLSNICKGHTIIFLQWSTIEEKTNFLVPLKFLWYLNLIPFPVGDPGFRLLDVEHQPEDPDHPDLQAVHAEGPVLIAVLGYNV